MPYPTLSSEAKQRVLVALRQEYDLNNLRPAAATSIGEAVDGHAGPMTTSRERQQRYRERRRRAGQQRVELWLEADDLARLETLRTPGERLEPLLMRALEATKGVPGHGPSPSRGEADPVTGDTLFLTFLQLFFPEDKPVYPRRAYGLRTLPLAALNTWLACQGYVLHAAKVRNRDWFVSCADQQGQTDVFGLFELRRI